VTVGCATIVIFELAPLAIAPSSQTIVRPREQDPAAVLIEKRTFTGFANVGDGRARRRRRAVVGDRDHASAQAPRE
jgi:hypothetical protein